MEPVLFTEVSGCQRGTHKVLGALLSDLRLAGAAELFWILFFFSSSSAQGTLALGSVLMVMLGW